MVDMSKVDMNARPEQAASDCDRIAVESEVLGA
jgi:hypothetical protein